ncbi:N-acetylmuramoyl-L-alanine amidase, partial [Pontibacter qinzhouensis]|uniref:N-acetylmuramoyl-L-alanine amidase n=1 Tax=Pontibacter qinzhouensis TaxID=2603253 RepID=UPI0034E21E46
LVSLLVGAGTLLASCSSNPYATTNKVYRKQVKAYAQALRQTPVVTPGEEALPQGDYWVGTTNFNLRKPNIVVIHHTEQDSTAQTLTTFTQTKTQVSAHYVIGRDGKVYHMLNDYLRAWHGGIGKWGNNSDINSSSIGIELDNNGQEPFPEVQIQSLLQVLAMLKKNYNIPDANFIGHADIAPVRKVDPSVHFPWKLLADNGYGLWYNEADLLPTLVLESEVRSDSTVALVQKLVYDSIPDSFNPQEALRIIGYDTHDMAAAVRAFKLHFIQRDINTPLTEQDRRVLFKLYKKYL